MTAPPPACPAHCWIADLSQEHNDAGVCACARKYPKHQEPLKVSEATAGTTTTFLPKGFPDLCRDWCPTLLNKHHSWRESPASSSSAAQARAATHASHQPGPSHAEGKRWACFSLAPCSGPPAASVPFPPLHFPRLGRCKISLGSSRSTWKA